MMLWLIQKLIDNLWYYMGGTLRPTILLAKWFGCVTNASNVLMNF